MNRERSVFIAGFAWLVLMLNILQFNPAFMISSGFNEPVHNEHIVDMAHDCCGDELVDCELHCELLAQYGLIAKSVPVVLIEAVDVFSIPAYSYKSVISPPCLRPPIA